MTDPVPEDPPVEDPPVEDPGPEPVTCTSVYPRDPSITCERPYNHSIRMIHQRQTGGPDSPTYEWE